MNMFKTTSATTAEEYIDSLIEPRKSEFKQLHELILQTLPDQKPCIMSGMIGYGKYRYKSSSGREGDWALILLASQKNYISLYVCAANGTEYLAEKYKKELPKTNIGKSCIRIKKLADVDMKILEKILKEAEQWGGMNKV